MMKQFKGLMRSLGGGKGMPRMPFGKGFRFPF